MEPRSQGELDVAPEHDVPCVAVFAPALILLIEIHEVEGEADVHLHAGGQGFWVCRMIQALGGDPVPCIPIGGEPGVALDAIVRADGINAQFVQTRSANAVVIDDRRNVHQAPLVEATVPVLGRHEIDDLYSATVGAAIRAGVCVIAGAQLRPAIPDDVYRRLTADLRRNGVFVIADLSGAQLDAALRGGVDVVKISHDELRNGGWSRSDSVSGVADAIRRMRLAGAQAVVVSRAERSCVFGFDEQVLEVRAPSLEVVDGRGGGDSMTAALAVSVARGWPLDDAVRLACAAGLLNVSRHGLGSGRRESIEQIADTVELRAVDGHSGRPDLESATRRDLVYLARRRDLPGRSTMSRDELLAALSVDS